MTHGVIDVFAFQEALLIEAIFGIALLTMIWAAFRRWLHYKEKMGRLVAERTAELASEHRGDMQRVEARLKAVEQILTDGRPTAKQIDAPTMVPLSDANSKRDEL